MIAALAVLLAMTFFWSSYRGHPRPGQGWYVVTDIGAAFGPFETEDEARRYPSSLPGRVDSWALRHGWEVRRNRA